MWFQIHSTPVRVGRANGVVLLLCTFGLFIFACTVNSEIFAKILFSRIALKDIFATLKNRY